MYKLVVFSALLAVACAKPSYLHSALVAPVHTVYAAPSAVSHQSRVDIHSSHLAPVHTWPVWSAPLAWAPHHAPLAWAPHHAPFAWAPHHAPLALAPHSPATVLSPHGVPLDTVDVVAAKAAHYQAKALAPHYIHKRSAVYPLHYSAPLVYAAPSAVSHQSRVDVHHSVPVVVPAPHHYVSYAPAVAYKSWPYFHHW